MNRFRSICGLLPILLLLLASGCDVYHRDITLKPRGNKIDRTLTVWKEQNNNLQDYPKEELAKIAAAYQADVPSKLDRKHTFEGTFEGKMPNEGGNVGTYTHWSSPFGTVSCYAERFGGNDNITAQLDKARAAANKLTDHLLAWLEVEFAKEPFWPTLRAAVDGEFRRDFQNVIITLPATVGDRVPFDDNEAAYSQRLETAFMRVAQYLLEHDYIEPLDVPVIVRSFVNSGRDGTEWLAKIVARKAGMASGASRLESLVLFRDPKRMDESIGRYLRTTSEYAKLLADREKKRKENPELPIEEIEPWDALDPLTKEILNMNSEDTRELKVVLHADNKPFSTNGVWNGEAKTVTWKGTQSPENRFPTFIYANWSVSNDTFQTEHFGKVVLKEAFLGWFVVWHKGLTDAEQKEWDDFVATLKPGTELFQKLEGFKFANDPPRPAVQGANWDRLAARPIDLILEGLKLPGGDSGSESSAP